MKRGFCSTFRIVILCLAVLAAFGSIAARLVVLQVVQRDELVSEVERARKRVQPLHANRGEILDSNHNALATNRYFYAVGIDPEVTRPEDETKLPQLAHLLGLPISEVAEAFHRNAGASDAADDSRIVRWVPLAEAVDDTTYERIAQLGIKGVRGDRISRRVYPNGSLAAHIIGYVNHEGTPAMGIEHELDFYLRGQDGWREIELNGQRRELAQFRGREIPPTDGDDVVLSIDSYVQHTIEQELREIVRKYNPHGATIIVSDPNDGFILGLANYPTFDLNNFNKADLASQRNIAITDIFEPGSTFKIVPASAALNEGIVTPQTMFNCAEGTMLFHGKLLKLPHDSEENGVLSVADIVAKSSNRGAAHLGALLGEDRLYHYASLFGFGQDTGIGLGGEVSGILHPVKDWDGLTITRLPMGHAVGVTPLQVHFAMSAVANGGVLMRPQVVRRVVDHDGGTIVEFSPVERRRVMRKETAELMSRLLVRVVSPIGTAGRAAIPGYEVAGKTGTTQKLIDGHYSNTHHIGSFVGYFPASKPRLVISVIIDDARLNGTAYGATVAGPSFKSIAETLIQYLGISKIERAGDKLNFAGSPAALISPRDRIR